MAGGQAKKTIARQVGLDPKTVRSYVATAVAAGLVATASEVSDELLAKTLAELPPSGGRPRGEAWAVCEAERGEIEKLLAQGLRLSKARKLLQRRGVEVPCSTLHRFAVEELGFGKTAPTVPVVDGKPGEELEVDAGWVLRLAADASGKRRKAKAWIFTPNVSRHRFVWPVVRETTASALIADYNQLIARSLSQPILEFERIRRMGRLAESPNSKTVIVGQSNGPTPVAHRADVAEKK